MPPYSMPDVDTATSIEANEIFLAPSVRRTSPFTSARVVASTTHAASVCHLSPAPGDDDAVRRFVGQHAVPRAERGGIGECRIDLR